MRSILSLGLALGLLLTSGARATTQGDAQTYLLSAVRLYENMDYEGSLTQLSLARQVPRNREQEVSLLLYEGILLAELNRWQESAASFKIALTLNANAKLPVQVSPKVENRFETLRELARRELAAQEVPVSAPASPVEKQGPSVAQPKFLVEKPLPPTEAISLPPKPVPTATPANLSPSRSLRGYSKIPAIAGSTLAVAGGVAWAISRNELHRLRTASPSLQTEDDVRRSVSQGRTFQTLGIGLMGVGTAGLLTAVCMYVFGGHAQQPMALGVGTDGSTAFVYGRWP